MKRFTEKQLADWKAYEKIRVGGRWNMFMPKAQRATGLTREEYAFVIENFSELRDVVSGKEAA